MTTELEPTYFECFFDESDYEMKPINEMSLKQLVIYKKQLLNLNDNKTLTKKQHALLTGDFMKGMWNEYPEKYINAPEKEAEHAQKMRDLERKKFKAECFKINKLQFENSKELLIEINALEEQLRNQSETKYKIEHNEYMKTKIICDCGMETIRSNMPRHKKSKCHQIYEAKLAAVETAKTLKKQAIQQKALIAAKSNNGYELDENGKIVWPVNEAGIRYYLTDANGKNIYPIHKTEKFEIYMRCKNGFTIIPSSTTGCKTCSICKLL